MNYQLAGAFRGRWIGRLHMAVTIRDVARQAGVSIATVSKVVNGNDSDISKATQERVRAAVEELGYQPNSLARSLRTRRSNTIGFIVPDFEMVLYPPMIKGIDMEASRRGYSLLCYSSNNSIEAEITGAKNLASRRIDGLIVNRIHVEELGDLVEGMDIPVVAIDRADLPVPIGMGQVYTDLPSMVKGAVRELVNHGRKRIALVCHSKNHSGMRYGAYREALQEAGLPFDDALVIEGQETFGGGRDAAIAALEAGDVDGMVCGNDLVAEGALAAIREKGLSYPDEVGVVAANVTYISSGVGRPFPCFQQPTNALGQMAAKMLLDHLIDGTQLFKQYIGYAFYPGAVQ